MTDDWSPLLRAVVGSHAYGLNHEGSDVDRMGFAAAPTEAFHGLKPPVGHPATRVTIAPDSTLHEIGKACALMLKCNPSVVEVLWLPDYEVLTPLAEDLLEIRDAFLHRRGVRNAYLGYATGQFKRLRNREDGTFSSDTRNRTAKHARHIWRLLIQAQELHALGSLTVRLAPYQVDLCRAFGDAVVNDPVQGLKDAELMLRVTEQMFDDIRGRLPDAPDEDKVEQYLRHVRATLWKKN